MAKTGPWGPWLLEILDPRGEFLRGQESGGQFGEPGLIRALLDRVGETNRFCFEVGASDGRFLSNTLALRDRGWSALLIEGDDKKLADLAGHASEKVHCVRQMVAGDDLDVLLARHGAPADLDFGVIDVDGQDAWLWKRLVLHRPRVLMIEYSGHLSSKVPPEGARLGQAGLKEIVELGQSKGYRALVRTNVNALFVLEGLI